MLQLNTKANLAKKIISPNTPFLVFNIRETLLFKFFWSILLTRYIRFSLNDHVWIRSESYIRLDKIK
jgi:hypothetical protein